MGIVETEISTALETQAPARQLAVIQWKQCRPDFLLLSCCHGSFVVVCHPLCLECRQGEYWSHWREQHRAAGFAVVAAKGTLHKQSLKVPLAKKGKLFPWNHGNLSTWASLCQVCTFLICQFDCYVVSCWECPVDSVRLCLTGTSNLHLANRDLCDLLFCFMLRLNSASHILAKRSVQERRFLLKIICFPRNFLVKANSFAFLLTYFFLLCSGTW